MWAIALYRSSPLSSGSQGGPRASEASVTGQGSSYLSTRMDIIQHFNNKYHYTGIQQLNTSARNVWELSTSKLSIYSDHPWCLWQHLMLALKKSSLHKFLYGSPLLPLHGQFYSDSPGPAPVPLLRPPFG